jgi:cell division protein FtsA
VPSVGGRAARVMPRQQLCQIIEPRVEELFQAVAYTIDQGNYRELLGAGVVITGGTTQLDGMPELAEQILGLPVRRAAPAGVGGLMDVVRSPAYATGVGLVKYGADKLRASPQRAVQKPIAVAMGPTWGTRLGQWFREVF